MGSIARRLPLFKATTPLSRMMKIVIAALFVLLVSCRPGDNGGPTNLPAKGAGGKPAKGAGDNNGPGLFLGPPQNFTTCKATITLYNVSSVAVNSTGGCSDRWNTQLLSGACYPPCPNATTWTGTIASGQITNLTCTLNTCPGTTVLCSSYCIDSTILGTSTAACPVIAAALDAYTPKKPCGLPFSPDGILGGLPSDLPSGLPSGIPGIKGKAKGGNRRRLS